MNFSLLLGHRNMLSAICQFLTYLTTRFLNLLGKLRDRLADVRALNQMALAIEIVLPSLIGNSILGKTLDIEVERPRIEATIETKYFM